MRRVLRGGLIGAIMVGTLWLAILILAGCFFFFTFPDPTDFCTLWLWWRGPGWTENFLYLATGISIGFIAGLVHVWLDGRGEFAATGVAPIPGNRTARILLAGLASLMAVVGAITIVPKCRVTAVGWFRGETCARGLPTSYWLGEFHSVTITKPVGGMMFDPQYLSLLYLGKLMEQEIGKDAVPGLAVMVADPDSNYVTRDAAVRTLGWIGPEAADATPALIVVLGDRKDSNHLMRYRVAETLERIGPAAKDAVPALVEAMNIWVDNPNNYVSALLKMGPSAKDAVPGLAAMLADPKARGVSRCAAVYALGQIEPATPALVEYLKDAGTDAVSGLALILTDSNSSRDSHRWAAAALGRIGPAAKEAIPALVAGWKNAPDEQQRRAIVEALNQIDPEAARKAGAN